MSTSYSSPVSGLLTFGDPRDSREWPDYLDLVGLGPEHVPELIQIVSDEDLNRADPESLEVWAPLHAWRALGQLRATAAIEPLLDLYHEEDDWAHEELPKVYGMIGRTAIPALTRHLADTSENMWARISTASSLEHIGAGDPSARDECVGVLSRQLERFTENDPDLNGFLIAYLIDLQAVEAAPLMERAFAAGSVDPTIAGDWEDVQVELGLKAARETPRARWPLFPMLDMPEHDTPHQENSAGKAAAKAKSKRKQAKASRKKNRKRK